MHEMTTQFGINVDENMLIGIRPIIDEILRWTILSKLGEALEEIHTKRWIYQPN